MNIGFIGAGNMGGAMIKGLLQAGVVEPESLFVKGGSGATAAALQQELGFELVHDYQAFTQCSFIFIATGAPVVLDVLAELAPYFSKESILISVASGYSVKEAQTALANDQAMVVHAIPNTPVSVNQGVIGAAFSESMDAERKAAACQLLETLGLVKEVPEKSLETVGTVAGCSPAFVDIFLEALADAAVMEGLGRELAYEIGAQMLKGSATLALTTKKHPGILKDQVTSPGGSTIKGVAALEKNGFRYAIIDAIKQANH